jgi:hypothetical protein
VIRAPSPSIRAAAPRDETRCVTPRFA